jgi:hypothetical protein
MKRKTLNVLVCLLFAFLFVRPVYAQRSNVFSLSAGFLQLKEALNLGLVFNGGQLGFQYTYRKIFASGEFSYQPGLAYGIGFSRGMHATQFHLDIADLSYLHDLYKTDAHAIKLGVDFTGNYNYERYPDLQSGHLFWKTEIGLSLRLKYNYTWKGQQLSLNVSNSFMGLTSRPQPEPDPYFYSLRLADYIRYAHSHMKFGSLNRYDHTRVSLEYYFNTAKRHSIMAGIDYLGLFYAPRYQQLTYFIQWSKTFTK